MPRGASAVLSFAVAFLSAPAVRADYDFMASCLRGDDGPDHKQKIESAFLEARVLASSGVRELWDDAGDHAAYETWFGPWDYTSPEWPAGDMLRQVRARAGLISDALYGWTFVFECDDVLNECQKRRRGGAVTVAYVDNTEQDEPLRIMICPPFFNITATTGPDRPAATMIHEVSHFQRNNTRNQDGAKTDDKKPESFDGAKALAKSDPGANVNNAYAYEGYLASDPSAGSGAGCEDTSDAGAATTSGCAISGQGERRRRGNLLLLVGAVGMIRRRKRSST